MSLPAFAPVDLAKSYRLFNHGPVTLVTSAHGGRRNVMAASWAMPLDFDPPKVSLVIDRNAYTRELMEAAGTFALNIPTRSMAEQVLAVGSRSGREGDKFAALSSLGDDLRFVLICSQARVVENTDERLVCLPLPHAKCQRCWHVRDDVGCNAEHPGLCGRCHSNLFGEGEQRAYA